MNERSLVTNLYRQLKALKVRIWALSVHYKPHDQQAIFPSKTMNRFVLAVVFVMVLPILACHHSVAHAQSDPLNNAYMPSADCNPAAPLEHCAERATREAASRFRLPQWSLWCCPLYHRVRRGE